MIDESCEVPREDLDEGFNPCRRQVVENGELEAYAHMYDVMNERYDREEDTSYINSVKRDKINPNTHTSIASGNNVALYSQNRVTKSEEQLGVLGSGSLNLDKRDDSVMTSKAVADYIAANIPNPLPVDQGGTGAQSRKSVAVSGSQGVPILANGGPSGPINSWTTVEAMGTFFNRTVINPQIANAFTTHTATTVADNDLLPTNALMIDYVAAHAMATPPDKFSYAVSPFPTGTWEGEMNVNVVPVFSVNIGAVTYVIARVYGSKKFNYTGTADNINLFSSLKPVGDYTSIFSGSTNIPLTLSVSGRSYTAGTYGLTPNGSDANLSLNNQIVSSVFNLGDFNISTNLKCVFGEGTNTPGVTVGVNCMALMWHSLS